MAIVNLSSYQKAVLPVFVIPFNGYYSLSIPSYSVFIYSVISYHNASYHFQSLIQQVNTLQTPSICAKLISWTVIDLYSHDQ